MYISITYTTGTKNENMNVVRKKKRLQEIVNFSKNGITHPHDQGKEDLIEDDQKRSLCQYKRF